MSRTHKLKVLIYGDVNLNIIDGSAVWLVSMAEASARAGAEVSVMLKSQIRNDRLVQNLRELPNVSVISPLGDAPSGQVEESYTPRKAAQAIVGQQVQTNFDVIICRGMAICTILAGNALVAPRLWSYITDIPPHVNPGDRRLERLEAIVEGSRRVFAQTEETRSYIEAIVPGAAGKTLILTPMIPDDLFDVDKTEVEDSPLEVVYSGKFAREWNTLEMVDLAARLVERKDSRFVFTMIGDKVQEDKQDPGWAVRMSAALNNAVAGGSIRWPGGMSRKRALERVSRADVGLSWRHESLDGSLELSTKLLEYAALGVPPIANRTYAHEELFGSDYELFVDDQQTVEDVLGLAASSRSVVRRSASRAREAVRDYSISKAAERLRKHFEAACLDVPLPNDAPAIRILVMSHDFKFAGDIISAFEKIPNSVVKLNKWDSLHKHDEAESERDLQWADVVFCEWAGPNAVWCSERVTSDQALLVRFHGFEVRGPWIRKLHLDKVDSLVFVSDFYRDSVTDELGWAKERTMVIPNSIDTSDMLRPKVSESQWHLGILGVVPMLKRLDRAVDLISDLVQLDDRYVLHVKGRAPWNYEWEWSKYRQRDAYLQALTDITDRGLAGHVSFEDFGPDVANWFRKIGWILSPSSRETFHLAPLEGMASGSIPVFWPRDGVREIFGERWLHNEEKSIATQIHETIVSGNYASESRVAIETARPFDTLNVGERWRKLIQIPHEHLRRS